jgi:nitrite reductase/ring-hydroxylating ferredoxin subunit
VNTLELFERHPGNPILTAADWPYPVNAVFNPAAAMRDGQTVLLARVEDRLYAFDDLCTCADEACPLSGGMLTGTTIMCQCHGSRFDITTGAVISGPASKALNVYEVHEIEGSIQIQAAG